MASAPPPTTPRASRGVPDDDGGAAKPKSKPKGGKSTKKPGSK
jgi:hypothetical protein